MKTPKMLPWLARKVGLSDAIVESLWAEAVRHASRETDGLDSGQHASIAVARLLELVEAKKVLADGQPAKANPGAEKQEAVFPARGRWPYSLIVAMKPAPEALDPSPMLVS